MKSKIDIFEERYSYGLAWYDEDGEGLRFGDDPEMERAPSPPKDPELAEHWHAYQAAKAAPGCEEGRFLAWESRSQAMAACRAARAAVKLAASNKPLPEWAKKAIAAGWKAPKGWKP